MVCQSCQIHWLGQVDFKLACALQKKLSAKRADNKINNALLFLEHDHVFTFGFNGYREYLRISEEEIADRNISCFQVDRSGPAAFYHGPGQLVGYPILDLQECGYSYHSYIKLLEKVIIHTFALFGVHAYREPGCSGISVMGSSLTSDDSDWLYSDNNSALVAAIGINVDENNVTRHGFFINVNPCLEHFNLIMPNGLKSCNFTSLQEVLGKPISVKDVIDATVRSFTKVFNFSLDVNQALLIDEKQMFGLQGVPGGWINDNGAFKNTYQFKR